jgi:maltose alpha-D-glucosyltransferase / alpha-amylase
VNLDPKEKPAAHEAPAAAPEVDALWYKDAVIYEVHVKAFADSNGDGVGDFAGLTAKLDYIRDLGVNAIWILPFYPSPFRDDGYDIADYHEIDPSFGTREDFKVFVREAHARGLRVITELVVNHTSDQHPWFQAARHAPKGSPKRDFYVWSDDKSRYAGTRIIFTDTEKSNWTWDEVAQQYYWHRFFSHQPDLNFDNPHVLKAVLHTMRYWLDQGVDGMRLDAIPYLVEREGTTCENLPETHALVKQIRAAIDAHYPDRMLLAEANQWPEDVRDYFGEGDECHMAYHFPLMPRMYMAIAQEDRYPITEIMAQTPDIPPNCQWAIFLRNHDELTLEMVTSKERDYMYQTYANDPRARLNLGIRRRLAPLLENNMDLIRLMNSLLLSMPGTPVIYYGDEIGMGDNIYAGDRNGVRTPMQWSPDRNAGFSRADPQRLYLPPIMDAVYGYEAVNVEAQSRDPSSLLNWMRRILAVRKTTQAFGRGTLQFLSPGNRKVLAYLREHGTEVLLCVVNLARSAQPVELDLSRYRGRVPVEMLGKTPFPPIGDLPYFVTLPGHGFYWFQLARGEDVPAWHEQRLAPEDLPVLVLFDGWSSIFRERVVPWRIAMAERIRTQLETTALPKFLAAQRWYASKGVHTRRMALADAGEWRDEKERGQWLLAAFRAELASGTGPLTFMPLSLVWEDDGEEERMRGVAGASVARVRQQARVGVMADALADERFVRALVRAVGAGDELRLGAGAIRGFTTHRFEEAAPGLAGAPPVRPAGASGTNTTLRIGDGLFLKVYRQLHPGINPEVEMGRFLTEVARFAHIVPVAGGAEYVAADGTVHALALLQSFVDNQGDGWSWTLDYVQRFLDAHRIASTPPAADAHAAYRVLAGTLGRRTAELHRALAAASGDAAFEPEPVRAEDVAGWVARVRAEATQAMEKLAAVASTLPAAAQAEAASLLAQRQALERRIAAAAEAPPAGLRIRHHGDYHLGQVLVAQNDFVIIDFEGEPARPLEERRQKHSPLRDVAGMLRSFEYAAAAALLRATAERPADLAVLEPLARSWAAETRAAFMEAYRAATEGAPLFGQGAPAPALLDLFTIEKALYELVYEIDHRPDWARIPLRGLLDLVAAAA